MRLTMMSPLSALFRVQLHQPYRFTAAKNICSPASLYSLASRKITKYSDTMIIATGKFHTDRLVINKILATPSRTARISSKLMLGDLAAQSRDASAVHQCG